MNERDEAPADPFFIPSEIVPKGRVYEWKRATEEGERPEVTLIHLKIRGWRPVPKSRHPDMASADPKKIERRGMLLMEKRTPKRRRPEMSEGNKMLLAQMAHLAETPKGHFPRLQPLVRCTFNGESFVNLATHLKV